MIRYSKKFYFFKVYENWFQYKFRIADLFSLNTYLHLKDIENKKVVGIKHHTATVELKLDQDAETIFSKFSSTIRNEVRKSEKEGVVCSFSGDVETFVKFYNDFASAINISLTSKRRVEEMKEHFVITFAYSGNELLAAHSYLADAEVGIARLYHSASKRFDENFDRNMIGRANKLLMYKDMLYFKEKGFKIYDFGGIAEGTTDKRLAGINEFKLSFGGEKVTCINYSSFGYEFLKKMGRKFGATGNG
ncbi:MAG: hypothetical protein QM737_20565 [Ferruginibacter sp.]